MFDGLTQVKIRRPEELWTLAYDALKARATEPKQAKEAKVAKNTKEAVEQQRLQLPA